MLIIPAISPLHIDQVLHNLLNSHDTDSIYLDYAKAYDKVNNELLLKKVWAYGTRTGKVNSWIKSVLTDRSQVVTVNGIYSILPCHRPQWSPPRLTTPTRPWVVGHRPTTETLSLTKFERQTARAERAGSQPPTYGARSNPLPDL